VCEYAERPYDGAADKLRFEAVRTGTGGRVRWRWRVALPASAHSLLKRLPLSFFFFWLLMNCFLLSPYLKTLC
jgi:hypothetical protein